MFCNIRLQIELTAEDMNQKDFSGALLEKVRQIYNGRCFQGKYIKHIAEIVYEGDVTIIGYNLSANGIINIVARAEYEYYNRYDIAVGCTVTKIEPGSGMVICSHEHMNMRMKARFPIYAEGASTPFPVIIEKCRYTVLNPRIAAFAIDFQPLVYPIEHVAVRNFSERDLFDMAETDALEAELKEVEAMEGRKEIRKKFDDMISYQKMGKPAGKIRDFKLGGDYIVILTPRPSTDDNFYVMDGDTKLYATMDFRDAHAQLVQNYNNSLRNMIRLLRYYDKARFAANQEIWDLYISNK